MNKVEIFTAVSPLIVNQVGVEVGLVTLDQHFVEDLGADSIDVVELIMATEEHFSIEIPDEDAEKLATVKMLVNYIYDHHDPNANQVVRGSIELGRVMDSAPDSPATEPLNDNSVRIYIDNTITQKRGYQADKSNSIMARETAKHQVEALQVMREKLFGSRLP